MDDVNIELSVEQVNVVLTALSQLPYNQVVDLIGNIQQQATQQLPKKEDIDETT